MVKIVLLVQGVSFVLIILEHIITPTTYVVVTEYGIRKIVFPVVLLDKHVQPIQLGMESVPNFFLFSIFLLTLTIFNLL